MPVDWSAEVERRVGGFLNLNNVSNLLMVVPGASGDIALATTAIRHIKSVRPDCEITIGVRDHLKHVARLCPGASNVISLAFDEHWDKRSLLLSHYRKLVDCVVVVGIYSEDMDLLTKCGLSLVDTMWLLSGLPKSTQSLKIWLECRDDRKEKEFFGSEKATYSTPLDVKRDIIISTDARSLQAMPIALTHDFVAILKGAGLTVFHNVLREADAMPGTIPLICSHEEFLAFRNRGFAYAGWRSGLCDIAAASSAPMLVLTHAATEWYSSHEASFGFNAMNIDCSCTEIFIENEDSANLDGVRDFVDRVIK